MIFNFCQLIFNCNFHELCRIETNEELNDDENKDDDYDENYDESNDENDGNITMGAEISVCQSLDTLNEIKEKIKNVKGAELIDLIKVCI